ncbi:MAG: hypothetical protein H7066_10610 [Cytophagaceae bacterium]|nr:hypothetical protein [Gemmatimonadaceae bacterium]
MPRASILSLASVVAALIAAPPASAQPVKLCDVARAFLVGGLHLTAIVDPDTIDDWRTKRRTPGCRVTASGFTDLGIRREAVRFYERVRAAGWVRTPDPMDAPNEASLRFRTSGVDCLFNVYEGVLLNTESELRVTGEGTAKAGESRYNVFAMCVPAAAAAPRDVGPDSTSRRGVRLDVGR